MPDTTDSDSERKADPRDKSTPFSRRRRRFPSRLMMLLRRTHLYAGLFLLPWVFLYGITGAMFNHHSLLPQGDIRAVPAPLVESSGIAGFPRPDQLASEVVDAINASEPDANVVISQNAVPEFTNHLMFESKVEGTRYVLHLDPIDHAMQIHQHPDENLQPQRLLTSVNNVRLETDPLSVARESAKHVLQESGVQAGSLKQIGWSKLNFLATVDGQPARITYVLNDGHVDISSYDGNHAMTPRGFFLRLHTSHGQPPHWNGRMLWSLFVDAMAIAMVTWGLTGLLMWWQIKRTRLTGACVMTISLATAAGMYWAMHHFYAATLL